MNASIDLEEYFIQVPLVARPRRSSSQVVGISMPGLEAPFSDGSISEGDAAKAQSKAKVQPNAMTDDFGGKR